MVWFKSRALSLVRASTDDQTTIGNSSARKISASCGLAEVAPAAGRACARGRVSHNLQNTGNYLIGKYGIRISVWCLLS